MSRIVIAGAWLVLGPLLMAGCSAEKQVSYVKDIKPILDQQCLNCHTEGGEGTEKSGLVMDSYQELMKGTKFGPVIIPGDSLTSALNMLVEGRADSSIRMPHHREPLKEEDIALLKNWVDQGAKNN